MPSRFVVQFTKWYHLLFLELKSTTFLQVFCNVRKSKICSQLTVTAGPTRWGDVAYWLKLFVEVAPSPTYLPMEKSKHVKKRPEGNLLPKPPPPPPVPNPHCRRTLCLASEHLHALSSSDMEGRCRASEHLHALPPLLRSSCEHEAVIKVASPCRCCSLSRLLWSYHHKTATSSSPSLYCRWVIDGMEEEGQVVCCWSTRAIVVSIRSFPRSFEYPNNTASTSSPS
jgi:hypothetical protein